MITLEHAQDRILQVLPPPQGEIVPLSVAADRFSQMRLEAPVDLPPFDNSSMDGYAVIANDVEHASPSHPVRLQLRDRVPAGDTPHAPITSNNCARVFTGSPLPPGANAVVMQEDTQIDPASPKEILVLEGVRPWESIRIRGEDVRCGTVVISAGDKLTVGMIALMAALGVKEVSVGQQPTVGLLSTGNELCEAGEPLSGGKIYESNRAALSLLTSRAGGLPRSYPLVADDPKATRAALETGLHQCDLLVTTGGVSVGEMDLVKQAFSDVGGQLDFWRVSMKPGRPFVFGQWKNKCLFGLPGNPVSAVVTFLTLVRPALLHWQGATDRTLPSHPGTLAAPLRNPGERRHFMRVRADSTGAVHPNAGQSSHMLHSLAQSNGLVEVPPNTNLPAGQTVTVLRWDLS